MADNQRVGTAERLKQIGVGVAGSLIMLIIVAIWGWVSGGGLIKVLGGAAQNELAEIQKGLTALQINQERKQDLLEARLHSLQTALVIPEGVIVLTGKSDCPELGDGWELYSEAVGRFPLAAGKAAGLQAGVVGGASTRVLTIEQIPAHTHEPKDEGHTHAAQAPDWRVVDNATSQGWPRGNVHYRFRSTDRGDGSPQSDDKDHRIASSALEHAKTGIGIGETGNGEAIETMPPYIALYFCRKT